MNYQDIFAGKSNFTVSNNKNEHYTFKVKMGNDHPIYGKNYFVRYLTGPDNNSSYTYLGMIREGGHLELTRASKLNKDSMPFKVFRFAERVLSGELELPKGYDILNAGCCFKCGKKLTTPESIKTGYGPVCGGRVK